MFAVLLSGSEAEGATTLDRWTNLNKLNNCSPKTIAQIISKLQTILCRKDIKYGHVIIQTVTRIKLDLVTDLLLIQCNKYYINLFMQTAKTCYIFRKVLKMI